MRARVFQQDINQLDSAFRIMESSGEVLNINSLPEEILIIIFSYLSQNKLGEIARVCRRWNVLTRSPVLWKNVDLENVPSDRFQSFLTKCSLNRLPNCVMHMRLQFRYNWDWFKCIGLNFKELAVLLHERCPRLKMLFLDQAKSKFASPFPTITFNTFPEIIDLCSQFLQTTQILVFRYSTFLDVSSRNEYAGISKVRVLALFRCNLGDSMLPFSKMPCLRELRLVDTSANNFWFRDGISFLNQLEVLDMGGSCVKSRTFQAIWNHALNLKELYLCGACLEDLDFHFTNSVFPHLKTICLKHCHKVTCEGIVSLIRSGKFLQNVYVNEAVAQFYAAHRFVIDNKSKLEIVKTIECKDHRKLDYLSKYHIDGDL